MKKLLFLFFLLLFISSAFSQTRIGIIMPYNGYSPNNTYAKNILKGVNKTLKIIDDIDISLFYPSSSDNLKRVSEYFINQKFNLILFCGFNFKDELTKIAKNYPDNLFGIIDAKLELPNVVSILFKVKEGAFLAGALAALHSKTGYVGFIGGMSGNVLQTFRNGFVSGAKHVNRKIQIITDYISPNPSGFSNPVEGNKLAEMQYLQGVDVIFAVAAGSNKGIIECAKENKSFVIGVDENQDALAKGFVLTSLLKNVDKAIYSISLLAKENKLKPGVKSFGLGSHGVSLTNFQYSSDVIGQNNINKLNTIRDNILTNKIEIK